MNYVERIDYARLMEPVALRLLGKPNPRLSRLPKNVRYGSNGSMSVNFETGKFYDHEKKIGGGVLDLIQRKVGCDRAAPPAIPAVNDASRRSQSNAPSRTANCSATKVIGSYSPRAPVPKSSMTSRRADKRRCESGQCVALRKFESLRVTLNRKSKHLGGGE
jgi:hypothetical protein